MAFATQSSSSGALTFSKNLLQTLTSPIASREKKKMTIHGDTRTDYYAWLRDPQWPKITNKAILGYIEAENAYTKAFFDRLKPLQEKLYQN